MPYVCALAPLCALALIAAPLGHDLGLELTRLAAYRAALLDGQLPPFWAGELYAGMGSPIFLFYGHLFLALASVLSFVSGTFMSAALLGLALMTAFAARVMQQTAAALGLGAPAQRVAAYAFVLSPYLLGDALIRNANAEYCALCVLPLALLGVARANALLVAGGSALVLCAHPLGALFIALSCPWIAGGARARWLALVRGVCLGLALSAWAWLPVLAYGASVQAAELLHGKLDFHRNFVTLGELVGLGSFYAPGPLPLSAAAVGGLLAWKRREHFVFALAAGVVVLAGLQLKAAAPVWEAAQVAKYLQFPWRLMGPLTLLGALLAAYVFERSAGVCRRLWELLVLLACMALALPQLSRVRLMPARVVEASLALAPAALARELQSATLGDEYLPLGATRALARVPARERPVIAEPELTVRTWVDEPRWLLVDVDTPRAAALCLARYQFSFWQLRLDARDQPLAAAGPGCLWLQVPAGQHRIEALLPMPRWRVLGMMASALTLAGLGIWLRRRKRRGAQG